MNVKETLHRLNISKVTICSLADVLPTELSKYFRSRRNVSEAKAHRIEQCTEELRHLLEDLWQAPIRPDLRDVESLRQLLDYVREAEKQNDADAVAIREMEKVYEGIGAER